MGYKPDEIVSVSAVKPSGQKSDVDVTVETRTGKHTDGISIRREDGGTVPVAWEVS